VSSGSSVAKSACLSGAFTLEGRVAFLGRVMKAFKDHMAAVNKAFEKSTLERKYRSLAKCFSFRAIAFAEGK